MANPSEALSGLAQHLINEGLLSTQVAQEAQHSAQQANTDFLSYLVRQKRINRKALSRSLSTHFGLPLLDMSVMTLQEKVVELVPEKLILEHNLLPLYQRGNRLYIAITDPTNIDGLDAVQFSTRLTIIPILVEPIALQQAIDAYTQPALADLSDYSEDITPTENEQEDTNSEADEAPVVRFINTILTTAIRQGASDIHFEPYETQYRVRSRIDGVLHEIHTAPANIASRVAARLKVLARLNIAERRVPQDGRMRLDISAKKAIDFRVNTCPTLFGEKVVLRILDASNIQLSIDSLGYESEQQHVFLENIHRPYGMILVTGPTGSGKTVSLYTALNILNTLDRNISTVEDPVEINVPGINQVNVNTSIGLQFSDALRAFLRQDPDVIMVGEIRDLETAEIAIKAAQTGHMVLSTLHTNDAPQTLSRLLNMGVPAFNIASAVSLIIAQRLVRKLCPICKKVEPLTEEALRSAGFTDADINSKFQAYKAVGCDDCSNGYKGRVGIYQMMPISDKMGEIILADGSVIELAEQAEKEGIDDLRRSGLKKVMQGATSLDEVIRVTME